MEKKKKRKPETLQAADKGRLTGLLSLFFCALCMAGILSSLSDTEFATPASYEDRTMRSWLLIFVLTAGLCAFALYLLFLIEKSAVGHGLLCVLLFAYLLLGPNFGITIDTLVIVLLTLFMLGETLLAPWQTCSKSKKNRAVFHEEEHAVRRHLVRWLSGIAALVCAVAGLVVRNYDALYEGAYEIEGFFYRCFEAATGSSLDEMQSGLISRRNNYPSGNTKLELTVNAQPTEPLYLYGFEGKDYADGKWTRVNDTRVLAEIEYGDENTGFSSMTNRYASMYYSMNQISQGNRAGRGRELTIRHTSGRYNYTYAPYYSSREYMENYYNYLLSREYSFRYYESNEMVIDWTHVGSGMEQMSQTYQKLQTDYIETIRQTYTEVPTERMPRLVRLCANNPCKTVDDATTFIVEYLNAGDITYTKTPGWSVGNIDVVEDFLFEKKRGYCEHFATAATLMYRLYDIPARYASGFKVMPDAFTIDGNGNYHAQVTDEDAHAWTEIFIENYGWTPIEVTPVGDGISLMPSLDFELPAVQGYILTADEDEDDDSVTIAGGEDEEDDTKEDTAENSTGRNDEDADNSIYGILLKIFYLADGIGLVILLLGLTACINTDRKKRRLEKLGSRQLFSALLSYIQDCGILMESHDGDKDFEKQFLEELPAKINSVSVQELSLFLGAMEEAAYSGRKEDAQKRKDALDVCLKIMEDLYRQQSLPHKLRIVLLPS